MTPPPELGRGRPLEPVRVSSPRRHPRARSPTGFFCDRSPGCWPPLDTSLLARLPENTASPRHGQGRAVLQGWASSRRTTAIAGGSPLGHDAPRPGSRAAGGGLGATFADDPGWRCLGFVSNPQARGSRPVRPHQRRAGAPHDRQRLYARQGVRVGWVLRVRRHRARDRLRSITEGATHDRSRDARLAPSRRRVWRTAVGTDRHRTSNDRADSRDGLPMHVVFIAFGGAVFLLCLFEPSGVSGEKQRTFVPPGRNNVGVIAKGVAATYETTGQLCPSGRAIPARRQGGPRQDLRRVMPVGRLIGWSCAGLRVRLPAALSRYRLETGTTSRRHRRRRHGGGDLRRTSCAVARESRAIASTSTRRSGRAIPAE